MRKQLREPCAVALIECVRGELGQSEILQAEMEREQQEFTGDSLEVESGAGHKEEAAQHDVVCKDRGCQDVPSGSWTFYPAFPKYGQRPVHFKECSIDEQYKVEITSGETLTDRKSTFQAHCELRRADQLGKEEVARK